MGRRGRDAVKEAYWREHLGAQACGGLSIRKYCVAQGLRESAFYLWKRTIRERDAEGAERQKQRPPRFAEVVVHEGRSAPGADCGPGAGVAVEFRCGARVRLERGFDEPTFAQAVRALLEAERC
jgi:hypothetical protein